MEKTDNTDKIDYGKIGLKCGLEIHQQLDTTKLFCSCPSTLRDDNPNIKIRRTLRAVAGEGGTIDIAAAHEQLKCKNFLYEAFDDTTCLVELDEEPPHPLNSDALATALEVALLIKSKVVDVIQVMRKTVIDGSNTSGFQRTALIAQNGEIETADGTVGISTICIEEDSARTTGENEREVAYRLDRLGVPLIEIATGPDITHPQQCMESAEKIGMILRSTGKVKRGIGTIRQDVNVSIRGGARVEIKGAQELRMLPTLVEYEALRQKTLLDIREELNHRNATPRCDIKDLTLLFKDTQVKIATETIKREGVILGMKLSGFGGLLGKEVQPGKRLGTEFSDRAKVVAGVGGMIHSDEFDAANPQKYGLTAELCKQVEQALSISDTRQGSYVLIADRKEKAEKALKAIVERAQEALKGVPSEVRKANADGTTTYMRPMPGAARMYPETDIPLIVPNLKSIVLPELIETKVARYAKQHGLSADLSKLIATSDRVFLFEELVKKHKAIKPAYIAEILTAKLTELRRDYQIDSEKITDEQLKSIFNLLDEGKIHKDIMLDVLIDTAKGTFSLDRYQGLKTEELHKELITIISENKGAPMGALMGIAVKKLRGKASGQKIAEMLQELAKGLHK